ncbi:Copper transporter [Musa troglodytarum]|uniref:Copper transporter n=1 Tax=Musa troglodytarum TaxID=320322 RepID=A0A9E7EHG7_9LILI|nr:Copper transporter [Musa troglodytarum]
MTFFWGKNSEILFAGWPGTRGGMYALALRVGLAYLGMIAIMSFNGGVLIVAVAGHALGFLLFGSAAARAIFRPWLADRFVCGVSLKSCILRSPHKSYLYKPWTEGICIHLSKSLCNHRAFVMKKNGWWLVTDQLRLQQHFCMVHSEITHMLVHFTFR